MSDDKPLRILQLTDPHLFAEADGCLLGLNTLFSLGKVIDLARSEYADPDLLLCTGDLSQDGSVQAYQRFRDAIAVFNTPSYWFPGNHDRMENMRQALGNDAPEFQQLVRTEHWQLILLNSQLPGKVPGLLAEDQLELLRTTLEANPDTHTLISFHHQPVPIDTHWLDPLGVKNADAFFSIIDGYSNVKVVLWGHIHQEYDEVRHGVRLLATPSTCVQFKPGSIEFSADTEPPGYRWLELHTDGRVETGVNRVAGIDFEVDYSIKGY